MFILTVTVEPVTSLGQTSFGGSILVPRRGLAHFRHRDAGGGFRHLQVERRGGHQGGPERLEVGLPVDRHGAGKVKTE